MLVLRKIPNGAKYFDTNKSMDQLKHRFTLPCFDQQSQNINKKTGFSKRVPVALFIITTYRMMGIINEASCCTMIV